MEVFEQNIIALRNQSSKLIISPSNTLSVDDPDDLMIVDGKLVGLLYPSKSEILNPLKFLRRLLNIRLTYISPIYLVILLEKNSTLLENREIVNSANVIIEIGETDTFLQRLQNPFKDVISFSKNAKEAVFWNYQRNLKLYKYASEQKKEFGIIKLNENLSIKYHNQSLGRSTIYSETFIFENNDAKRIFLLNNSNKIKSVAASLQSFLTMSFFKRFSISNNVVCSIENPHQDLSIFNAHINYLNNDSINKLCFAGFTPMSMSNKEELHNYLKTFSLYGKKK